MDHPLILKSSARDASFVAYELQLAHNTLPSLLLLQSHHLFEKRTGALEAWSCQTSAGQMCMLRLSVAGHVSFLAGNIIAADTIILPCSYVVLQNSVANQW